MSRFLLKRLWHGFLVVVGVTTIVFVVTRLIGDPVAMMLPIDASEEERAALRAVLGLDRPIAAQYLHFVTDVATFDFGDSLWQRRPAMAIIMERLPMTLLLGLTGTACAVLIAIPIGIFSALNPSGIVDRVTLVTGILGLSVPQFWLGLLLIIGFGVYLKWLPTSGTGSAWHIILPAMTLAARSTARLTAVVRSAMVDELNKPYYRTARAKGLSRLRAVGGHALRNASVTIVTLTGWEAVTILAGGIIVVETVFAWPGLGLTIVQALDRQDLVLLQATVFSVAVMAVVINIMVDIIHKVLDPRVELN